MKAQDIMTQPVVSVRPDDTVASAIRLMLQKRISGLPVVDAAGRLVGMVTEGDFLRRAEVGTQRKRPRWLEFLMGPGRLADEYVHTHGRKVEEVMTVEPVSVAGDCPLDRIVALMEKRRIKRVPVVRDNKVIGMVSRANLLRALASAAAELKPAPASDKTIRDRIVAEIARQKWAPVVALDVTVRDGVANLWGTITDERERKALIVAAENVPGVKAVRDHVVWIEPTSGMIFDPSAEATELPKAS